MPAQAIIDAGPLVALFNGRDADHERVVAWLRGSSAMLVCTTPVVTEVMYLLDFSHGAQQDFLRWIAAGAVRCVELTDEDWARIVTLHAKYADRPMDFADATLVAIAERLGIGVAVTLDDDFRIYRLGDRRSFSLPLLDGI